jgi:uncharacterized protein YuzE
MSSTLETRQKFAAHISANWGKFMTEAATTGNLDNLKSLFHEREVYVVLQGGDGEETEFMIGTDPTICHMTWEEFGEHAFADLKTQDYKLTQSSMLGLLGNRMILEAGRINNQDECYMAATSLIEFDEEGKVIGFEAFCDINAESLTAAAQDSKDAA